MSQRFLCIVKKFKIKKKCVPVARFGGKRWTKKNDREQSLK